MAKKNYAELAEKIIQLVGSKENIVNVFHCITRLRFNLKDKDLVNIDELEKQKGVLGVQWAGEQLQIVIGQDVEDVYKEVCAKGSFKIEKAIDENLDASKKKFSIASFFQALADSVVPVIPILVACGLVQAIVSLGTNFGFLNAEESTYKVLTFVGNAGFYFLPIFLGSTSAKKFGCNPAIGMLLGAILIHPSFIQYVTAGESITIFGLPIYNTSYSSTIFPIILTVFVASYVEKGLKKIAPKSFRTIIVPTLTVLIMTPLSLCLLAPIGAIVGNALTGAIYWIYNNLGLLALPILGAVYPLMVIVGLHTCTGAIIVQLFSTLGYEPLFLPINVVSNFNQGMAALGIAFKTKNNDVKDSAMACGITTVLSGVTEPTLFGTNLKYKTGLYASIIGNAVGLLIFSIFNVVCYNFSVVGIFAFASFIGGPTTNLIFAIIGIVAGWITTFVLSYIFYKDAD